MSIAGTCTPPGFPESPQFNSDCGEPNVLSDSTASALWKAVRKGTAPAFSTTNLK